MTPPLPNPFITEPSALTSEALSAIMAELERALELPAFLVSPSAEYLETIWERAA